LVVRSFSLVKKRLPPPHAHGGVDPCDPGVPISASLTAAVLLSPEIISRLYIFQQSFQLASLFIICTITINQSQVLLLCCAHSSAYSAVSAIIPTTALTYNKPCNVCLYIGVCRQYVYIQLVCNVMLTNNWSRSTTTRCTHIQIQT
jgi:hypothetical protein